MATQYDSIIFDLDGTLWDATAACVSCWNAGLDEAGIDQRVNTDDIRRVTGIPFHECVSTLFGGTDDIDLEQLGALINTHEQQSLLTNGVQLYENLISGLEVLSKQYGLYIVSNCQSWYLQGFLDFSDSRHLFKDQTCHGDMGLLKSEMIRAIMQRNSLSQSLYIGDTASDEKAARDAGIDFGYAAYGYGSIESAVFSFPTFQAIVKALSQHSKHDENSTIHP